MPNPWFRVYGEIIDDEKLLLLAFQDRWHFVALLALKNRGVLDENDGDMLHRKLCVKLGLHKAELEELGKRLSDVGLIDRKTFQPLAWDNRQFQSDGSTERVRAYRERMKRSGNVPVTPQDTDTDTDTDTEIGQKKRAKATRFRPPTLEEVTEYCQQRENSVNPQKFIDHYTGNGWMRGKTKMKDWKAVIRTWEQNEDENRTRTGSNSRTTFDDKIRRLRETAEEGEPGLDSAGGNARGQILARVR